MLDAWANKAYARRAMRDALLRGEAPMVSHLLYTQRGVLDDGVADERDIGIAAGLSWGDVAEVTVVYVDRGMTRGKEIGIARARAVGRPVTYRSLDGHNVGVRGGSL
jgi:hypothetical protein